MDIGVFKLENCPAGPTWKTAKPEPTPAPAPLKLEAAKPCITADAEIAAALLMEQAELERLNTLEALMLEQQPLEGLLAQMEDQVRAPGAQPAMGCGNATSMPLVAHGEMLQYVCACSYTSMMTWGCVGQGALDRMEFRS